MPDDITQRWSADLAQVPTQPPCYIGDMLLLATRSAEDPAHAVLHAFDLVDGALRWEKALPYALVSGLQPCRLTDGWQMLVSTSSSDLLRGEAALLALDLAGEERWRWSPGGQRLSQVSVVDGQIICTAESQTLVRLDAATGAVLWQLPLAQTVVEATASQAAPAVAKDGFYLAYRGHHLLALTPDGQPRWHFEAQEEGWLDRSPLLLGERVVAASSDGFVLALARVDGALLWRQAVGPQRRLSPPATDGARLFVGAQDGLVALDPTDGRIGWHYATQRPFVARPLAHAGVVYAANHDHYVYALSAKSGELLWRHALTRRIEQAPALAWLDEQPLLVAIDRGGRLTVLERPLEAEAIPPPLQPEAEDALYALQHRLKAHFNLDELKGLCGALGLNYDELPHATRGELARELPGYLSRRGRLEELLALCRRERPLVEW